MAETHQIAGPARGEPLPRGRVGVRVRIPLSGTPSSRWSRVLTARLSAALTGHAAVGHLKLGELVQGADIVLEGVEAPEASHLGEALTNAVAAANRDSQHSAHGPEPQNMSQEQADAIAGQIKLEYEASAARKRGPVSFPGR